MQLAVYNPSAFWCQAGSAAAAPHGVARLNVLGCDSRSKPSCVVSHAAVCFASCDCNGPATEQESTTAPEATEQESTKAPKVTEQESTTAPKATEQGSTAAPKITEQESTKAPKATEQGSTTAPKITEHVPARWVSTFSHCRPLSTSMFRK